jgi:Tfp pilus assembly protein PilX
MTHNHSHSRLTRATAREEGMALLIAVIVLLLMSALGLAALQHAGDEASGSGRARRKDSTLYAADSGIKIIQMKLLTTYVASPSMSAVNLDEPTLVKDALGNPIAIKSGAPENGTLPTAAQSIAADPNVPSENQDGYMLNQGSPASQQFRPVRADVTALDVANGMVHLQAQFSVLEGTGGGSY